MAVLNYNTTYHSSLGCEPSRIVHGRVTYNILDHRLGLNPNPKILPTNDIAEEFQRRTQILIDKTKKNIMQSYLKYKEYYDRKDKATQLELGDYCFILQPLADHQGSKIPLREFRWIGPDVIKKVLPNENYIVRKLNSNKTQILHRIRLRKYTPNATLQDHRPEGNLQADDEIIIPQDDLYIISWETDFDNFPTFHASKSKSDEYLADSDQQDAISTDLDLRSNRRDENTDDATTGQRGNQISDAGLRSTRRQQDTSSADTEQLPEQPDANMTETDLRSFQPQQDTDSETVEKTSKGPSDVADSEFFDARGKDIIVPDLSSDENEEMVVENESPRGGKYNLRPNPTPNFSDEYRYQQKKVNSLHPVILIELDSCGALTNYRLFITQQTQNIYIKQKHKKNSKIYKIQIGFTTSSNGSSAERVCRTATVWFSSLVPHFSSSWPY